VYMGPRGPYLLVLEMFWRFKILRNFEKFFAKKKFLEYRSE
jgi:hypothetical protein